jgi:VWFA-related protein
VELVQLQVGVADTNGNFVSGLSAEDFVVTVDDDPRPAQVAYEIDLRRSPGDDSGPLRQRAQAYTAEASLPPAARRHFLLIFDLTFTNGRGIREARRAALSFLDDALHLSDLVGVATMSRYGIDLRVPFTRDRAPVRTAVESIGLAETSARILLGSDNPVTAAGAEPAGPGLTLGFLEYAAATAAYLSNLEQLGEVLQAIEGRKHLVMFSAGMTDQVLVGSLRALASAAEQRGVGIDGGGYVVPYGDPEEAGGSSQVRDAIAEATEQLMNSDAVVHAVSVRRLGLRGDGRQSLQYLSDGTGGEAYWNHNDLSVPLRQIEEATSRYYVIAYRRSPSDGDTVKLQVRALPDGVDVVSAPTRLSPPPAFGEMDEMQRQLQLSEAMANDQGFGAMELSLRVVPFPVPAGTDAALLVALEVPAAEITRLEALHGPGALRLEIAGLARLEDGTTAAAFRRAAELGDDFMNRDPRARSFRYADVISVPPGEGRLRLLVRESTVGELTAITQRYWAADPAPDEMFLAQPIAVELKDLAGSILELGFDPLAYDGRRLTPIPSPQASPDEPADVLLIVYNLPEVPGALAVSIELAPVGDADPQPAREIRILDTNTERGIVRLLVRFQLPATTPTGDARLWVRVTDPSTGAYREQPMTLGVLPR